MSSTEAGTDRPPVQEVIAQRVLDRSVEWFPELGEPPTVRLRPLSSRARSTLYLVELSTDGRQERLLAKVRRPQAPAAVGVGERPRLSAQPLASAQLTALEYAALRSIHEALGAGRSRFGAVRPLDHVPAVDAILMDYVPGTPLRRVLTGQSRLVPTRDPLHARSPGLPTMWYDAGAWLRAFQAAVPRNGEPPRQATARDVAERFGAYEEFLSGRLGGRTVGGLGERGAALARDVLPDRIRLAVGHGDYAPRNVLVGCPDRRLVVVDPMPRWAVPHYEDLCRFLVGVRLLGLQVHSHGLAYGRRWVEAVEDEVIRGYFQEDEVQIAQLRCYQLLIVLDKWSALVDSGGSGWRSRLTTGSAVRAGGFLRHQGRRLLDLASADGA